MSNWVRYGDPRPPREYTGHRSLTPEELADAQAVLAALGLHDDRAGKRVVAVQRVLEGVRDREAARVRATFPMIICEPAA